MVVKISKEHKNIQVKGKESENLFSLLQIKVTLTWLIEQVSVMYVPCVQECETQQEIRIK